MLIDILTTIGVLTKLSCIYLALTIIAVGNALPDAIVTISMAKKGKVLLGITGSYAGQLFGLLVGFGTAMLKKTVTEKRAVEFPLFKEWRKNLMSIFVVFVGLITLITTYVYGMKNNRKFDAKFGKILLNYYIVFLLVATVIAFKEAYF